MPPVDGDPYSDTDVMVEFVKPVPDGATEIPQVEPEPAQGTIGAPTIASAVINSENPNQVVITLNAPSGLGFGEGISASNLATVISFSETETIVTAVADLTAKTITVTCDNELVPTSESVIIAANALTNGGVANAGSMSKAMQSA